MITRPENHRLHVILLRNLIHNLSTSSFNLHHLCYKLFFIPSHCCYNLISLIPTRPPISTSSFWSRSPTCYIWAEQAVCFDLRLIKKDYLQTNAFSNLVVVEQREYLHALQRKTTGRGATSEVIREIASWTRPGLTLGTLISASTI